MNLNKIILGLLLCFGFLSYNSCAQTKTVVKTEAPTPIPVPEEVVMPEPVEAEPMPSFSVDKKMIELGTVKKGETRNFEYQLTNTGNVDLKIDFVSTCDCTTVDHPFRIKVNQTVPLKITFDSKEKDEEETIDIDIYFINKDPKTDRELHQLIQYHFDIEK